ncbi:MAG: matrixin family metalloprotease, partial [Thaumarchaeota archaeon]|nr:matrixin family metalloprotease [Nitrososphaerota archaeon]
MGGKLVGLALVLMVVLGLGITSLNIPIQSNSVSWPFAAISKGATSALVSAILPKAELTQLTKETGQQSFSISLVSPYRGYAASWSKTDLTVLVTTTPTIGVTAGSSQVTAAGKAVAEWNKALDWFADTNPSYSYLGNLNMNLYVAGVNDTAIQGRPDITIRFTNRLGSSQAAGVANLEFSRGPSISGAEITVRTQGTSQMILQNVVLHELGHALGLGHAITLGDLMYSRLQRGADRSTICPSTLDLFALASVYQWITVGIYTPYRGSSVSLPVNLPYNFALCT